QEGWDRVSQNFPKRFDFTILVDTGSPSLIKSAIEHYFTEMTSKPFVIIDHHTTRQPFGFDTIDIVEPACAAAEVITQIAIDLKWPLNEQAAAKLATALLADSLNLTTPDSTAHSVEMLAHLVRSGANLHELYKLKRETSALTPDLVHLKGRLLASVEFHADDRLAIAEIPPDVVEQYKDIHEPYTLILSDMQWAKGVELIAVFKNYGTKINVPLRSTIGLAAPIAEQFDGGGHANAAAYPINRENSSQGALSGVSENYGIAAFSPRACPICALSRACPICALSRARPICALSLASPRCHMVWLHPTHRLPPL
ncbi:MAG: hypothetical protein K0S68_721, partial [Candidatus Saccharibacteria bacterium]|nr:hypothetical protein [Candidatus Saccharibacteria bacterium]